MKKSRQHGFGVIELILIVVIIAIIGAIGFYVYSANQTTPATNQPSSSTSQTQTTNEDYLVISEWGVQLTTGSLTKDAEYVIKDEHTAWISTPTYVNKVGGASCKADSSTGQLVRGKAGYDYSGLGSKIEDYSYDYTNESGESVQVTAIKVGDYYYIWQSPQAACAEPTTTNVATMNTYQAALAELAATVQAIPAE